MLRVRLQTVGITRSVIVNALRKFESAGVIESRSSGMKGTYIKVINEVVFEEIKNLIKTNKRSDAYIGIMIHKCSASVLFFMVKLSKLE